ncbi:rare lipoprotein A (peptidoglycan hydrolase) [Crossiella equi]|uniref:Rare lipoprotein A (Peptidoglycan hydrolase) n=1 Tax=Crossiella equi TaxID=130796 RepID=A0ABS5ASU5_9PSEU|nr:cysteine/serine endopeptidase inhibitor [Crossiella equi]MBP2479472.1 rare lipoprotein A (peptidoglycan hydrolase) [Crossiella equi]
MRYPDVLHPQARQRAGRACAIPLTAAGTAQAGIPFNQVKNGQASWYNDAGYGSCGTQTNAATEILVAAPAAYWTTANPNNDPLCQGVFIAATHNGRTVRAQVRDKCPSRGPDKIDLSLPAFQRLADPGIGIINITWKFVR